jgi:hypothetical protein
MWGEINMLIHHFRIPYLFQPTSSWYFLNLKSLKTNSLSTHPNILLGAIHIVNILGKVMLSIETKQIKCVVVVGTPNYASKLCVCLKLAVCKICFPFT